MGDKAELRSDLYLDAASLDRLAYDLFTEEGPVDLSCVDVGDAQIECAVDRPDRFALSRAPSLV